MQNHHMTTQYLETALSDEMRGTTPSGPQAREVWLRPAQMVVIRCHDLGIGLSVANEKHPAIVEPGQFPDSPPPSVSPNSEHVSTGPMSTPSRRSNVELNTDQQMETSDAPPATGSSKERLQPQGSSDDSSDDDSLRAVL